MSAHGDPKLEYMLTFGPTASAQADINTYSKPKEACKAVKGYLKVLAARLAGGLRVLHGMNSKIKEVGSQEKDNIKYLPSTQFAHVLGPRVAFMSTNQATSMTPIGCDISIGGRDLHGSGWRKQVAKISAASTAVRGGKQQLL